MYTSEPVATVETFEIFQNSIYIYTGRLTGNLFSYLRSISIKTIKNREKKQKQNRNIS